MKSELKLLLLEDDPSDVELIKKNLQRSGLSFSTTIASDKNEFVMAINSTAFDIILADNSLPQFNSVNALSMLRGQQFDTPFILVTGTVSEEFAVEVIHKGADDYILKSNLGKLPAAITNALEKQKMKVEKTRAEHALRESEQRYRILFEQASDGIVIADRTGHLLDANTRACKMTGYSLAELQQLTIADTFFKDDLKNKPVHFEELLSGKAVLSQHCIKRKDGTWIDAEVNAKLLPDGRFQAIMRDITDRKKLEKQLMAEKMRQQKRLVQATLDGQEKERTQIGIELHDNINQMLAAARLLLNAAITDPSIKDDMLKRSEASIERVINEVRKLSRSLVTPSFEEQGLRDSIQELLETIQLTTTIKIHTHIDEELLDALNQHQQIALYRIIQEQLNNILKHAQASHITLVIEEQQESMHLLIADDGKGFLVNAKRKGIGLSNIQSRVEILNGNFDIQSRPGNGSTMSILWPFSTDDHH